MDLDTPVYCRGNKDGESYSKKTIGELTIGDLIYDINGELTEVIHLNPIIFEDIYKITFEDGEEIECNGEHLWNVYDKCTINKDLLLERDTQFLYNYYSKKDNIKYRYYVPCCLDNNLFSNGINEKAIIKIEKTNKKKPMRCITVSNDSGLFLCGDKFTVTHNSYLAAPYIMTRSILIPNHSTYIMCPAGTQAQETFTKIEDLAKCKIQSVSGATKVFWDELIKAGTSDGFVHDKNSYHCELFNGSTINTLNSNPKTIVGMRSYLNFYDEAGEQFCLYPLNCWNILRAY